MKIKIGGDRFLIFEGGGDFPPLPDGFSGWIAVSPKRPNRLNYYNYLGKPVPFCGNATRALAFYLLGGGGGEVDIEASGEKRVVVRGDFVGIDLRVGLDLRGEYSVVRMEGVEHVVLPVSGISDVNLREVYNGFVRGGLEFHVNVYEPVGEGILVRTWEYGYPEEAEGCATGSLSAACDHLLRNSLRETRVKVRSGDVGWVHGDGERCWLWNRVEVLP